MDILANAVSDLCNRLSIRVRKTVQPKASRAKTKGRSNTNSKPSPSVSSLPIPKRNLPNKRILLSCNKPKSLSAKQSVYNPIIPESPI